MFIAGEAARITAAASKYRQYEVHHFPSSSRDPRARADRKPAASQSIPVDQENVRKAKAVLDQIIQALGGQAYLTIQDITQEGRTYSFYLGGPNSLGV